VTRRRRWNAERADTYDLRLVVRCRNRRFLGVGIGEPAPLIAIKEARRLPIRSDDEPTAGQVFHAQVLDGNLFDGSAETSTYECPDHPNGHLVDGERLRSAIYRLCRPGKVANVDVGNIERGAATGG
jgi:hypothetical protein